MKKENIKKNRNEYFDNTSRMFVGATIVLGPNWPVIASVSMSSPIAYFPLQEKKQNAESVSKCPSLHVATNLNNENSFWGDDGFPVCKDCKQKILVAPSHIEKEYGVTILDAALRRFKELPKWGEMSDNDLTIKMWREERLERRRWKSEWFTKV